MKKICVFILMVTMFLCCYSLPAEAAVKEVRGVWVSSVYNLDYPFSGTTSQSKLEKEASDILDQCVEMGMNTIFLQVRPSADALYQSSIFPWSKYLTGKQGVAPENGFDPLTYWVAAAHQRGIQLHAWFNPYRVAVNEADYNGLSSSNPAKIHTDWVYQYNGKYYFNPGIPEVRQMLLDGAEEILRNYDVDGIHMDDYFYPGSGGNYDDATFAAYSRGFADKDAWRRDNNDLLIKDLHQIAVTYRKIFGVSPAGVWANKGDNSLGSDTRGYQTYYSSYADTRRWVKEEWVDYICPQIYWPIGDKAADYQTLVYWWADVVKGTNVDLYIGMADYRYPSTSTGSWKDYNIIRQQMALNERIPQIKGEMHFTFGSMMNDTNLKRIYVDVYKNGVPFLSRLRQSSQPHTPYMQGDQGKFFPEDGVTRAEIAAIFSRLVVDDGGNALFDPNQSYGTKFTDVKKTDWFCNAVGFMGQQGLLAGYTDGTFRPEAKITRAECATILTRFFLLDSKKSSGYTDVGKTHWAYLAISNCSEYGFLLGYPNHSFAPDAEIKRCEAVTLLNRFLERKPQKEFFDGNPSLNPYSDVVKGHWAYYDILEASVNHGTH